MMGKIGEGEMIGASLFKHVANITFQMVDKVICEIVLEEPVFKECNGTVE
jgi:hypothetical protein